VSTWIKLLDTFPEHPDVLDLTDAAFRAYVEALCYCSRNLTDGAMTDAAVRRLGIRPKVTAELVDAGLWARSSDGYVVVNYTKHQRSRDEVETLRERGTRRQALVRSPELRSFIRERDRDLCRYCGVAVRWKDRRSPQGGTYDHVDPEGSNSEDNLVVCCRACNSRKGSRTPAAAGMVLLQPGSNLDTDPDRPPGLSRPETETEAETDTPLPPAPADLDPPSPYGWAAKDPAVPTHIDDARQRLRSRTN
jgi:5-methylcytosine-specific restriction endonuclease McrA